MSEGPRIVVAGGGVAALEALLALRDLGGSRGHITLVAPNESFAFPALSALEPLGLARAPRASLRSLVRSCGARLVTGVVGEVSGGGRLVRLRDGRRMEADVLVLGLGARREAPFDGGVALGMPGHNEAFAEVVDDLATGAERSVVLVVPPGVGWTLPVYEAAFFAAAVAPPRFGTPRVTVVTPEERPIALFGPAVSAVVAARLERAGVRFTGSHVPRVERGVLRSLAGAAPARLVTLVRPQGRLLRGVPRDAAGWLDTDRFARVRGLDGVYAAGDMTGFAVKQGGLAAQQAVAAASTIAAGLGADVAPEPFRPVLRGVLAGGGDALWMRAPICGGCGEGEVSTEPLWWPPTRVAGRYLSAYLYARDDTVAGAR